MMLSQFWAAGYSAAEDHEPLFSVELFTSEQTIGSIAANIAKLPELLNALYALTSVRALAIP
jgi:hypothetical protein